MLCVTFTNRAANEMKRRVRATLGDLDLGLICTFHAFCVQRLKEDHPRPQLPEEFRHPRRCGSKANPAQDLRRHGPRPARHHRATHPRRSTGGEKAFRHELHRRYSRTG
ncbi:MAG: UvrD-helicase domain-containing protein [Zoogloeaceae bacterium]|nr:UvrD-helicase domain-containing protein [Zoogloeaceae bacterium]